MTDDPYEELGIPHDADDKAVRLAYRRRVKKTHPDSPQGSAEAFRKTNRALAVLIDPKRRARYDAGEPDEPEKTKAKKINDILAAEITKIMAPFFGGTGRDPRRFDLVAAIAASLESEISRCRIGLTNGDGVAEVHEDVRRRLSGGPPGDHLGILFSDILREGRKKRAEAVDRIEMLEAALAVVRAYKYRAEIPLFGAGGGVTVTSLADFENLLR